MFKTNINTKKKINECIINVCFKNASKLCDFQALTDSLDILFDVVVSLMSSGEILA